MNFRFAKHSDIDQITDLHHKVRNLYDVGFFSKTTKSFLKAYYRVMINDPNEIILCAITDNGDIRGFCSGSLDVKKQIENLKKHKIKLGISLIPSFILNPLLIKEVFKRLVSLKGDKTKYTVQAGARSEYWSWDSDYKNSEYSVELLNRFYQVFYVLGIEEVYFEVDLINKKVYKFHKINGAESLDEIVLPDGRERMIMKYNLEKKFKI